VPHVEAARNLLFGLLALQNNFIDRVALLAGFAAWTADRSCSLGQILLERHALSPSRHMLLEALVAEHLKLHGDDPDRSLAALSSIGSVRDDLSLIADPGIQSGLTHVSAERSGHETDPSATVLPTSVGDATSAGTRFVILRPHAKGGLGEVFVARDTELNREVALKEIKPEFADDQRVRSRFEFEAEVTGGLEHPGIVPVYGLGHLPDGRPFYAMRFIKGRSLKDAIKRFHQAERQPGRDRGESALELRELLGRFIDVCDAVAYAHSRHVLHRDLKPGNIMLGKYGETLVVDWGLAKALDRPEHQSPIEGSELPLKPASGSALEPTVAGSAVGTLAYMSPEQAAGRLDQLGPWSDVYGLGATLYHVLTGHTACQSDDREEFIRRITAGDIPRPRSLNPRIDKALEAVCVKAMALTPRERYDSVLALKVDLERWLADEPVTAWREPLAPRGRRWVRRHQGLVAAAVAAVFVAAVASVAISTLISMSNRKLESANRQLGTANETIGRNLNLIKSQNQELDESNRNLKLARGEAEKERDQAKEVTEFLVSSFRKPDPDRDGKDVKAVEVLRSAVKEVESRENMAPPTRATILNAVGETYSGLGLRHEAVGLFEKVLAIRNKEMGVNDLATLRTKRDLAAACFGAEQYNRAIPLFEETVTAFRAKLGDDDAETLRSMSDLGSSYAEAGQLDRALSLLEQTLKKQTAKLGEHHTDTLDSANSLALIYVASGQIDLAIALLERARATARTKLGPHHATTSQLTHNLAEAYRQAEKPDAAIPLLEELLRQSELKLGGDHPATLATMNSLALSYQDAGQLDRAIALFEQIAKVQRVKYHEDDISTLITINNLAWAYDSAGNLDRAIPLYEQALQGLRIKLGEKHQMTIHIQRNLAVAYSAKERFRDAEVLFRKTIDVARRDHPFNEVFYAASLNMLGRCLNQQARHAEAIPLFREAIEVMGKAHPNDWALLAPGVCSARRSPVRRALSPPRCCCWRRTGSSRSGAIR
jgi:serine/threonine protein kinase